MSLNLSLMNVLEPSPPAPLTKLHVLSIDGEQPVDDAALGVVAGLPDLREVEPYSARITNVGLLGFYSAPAAA